MNNQNNSKKTEILPVLDREGIRRFISFTDKLYRGDDKYTPFMKRDFRKTLERLIIHERTYRALVATDESGEILGRILLTVAPNKHLSTGRCGFFSCYECVESNDVANALLTAAIETLREMGAEYFSGSFSPFDPDNRRGIMVEGFDHAPLIFTSYNKEYYDAQLISFGLAKDIDTYQYLIPHDDVIFEKLTRLAEHTARRYGLRVDTLDFSNIERDIADVTSVLNEASTDINYQSAPSEKEIRETLSNWRQFLNPRLILIVRRNEDNAPVGFAMGMPDYFELFRRVRGRSDPISLLRMLAGRRKIHSVRAMLQYVIPAYQKNGTIVMIVQRMLSEMWNIGYERIEAGTILENNIPSLKVLTSIGGELTRVYRIYAMSINNDVQGDKDADF